jgi:polysaccharide biosynthesis transport protein
VPTEERSTTYGVEATREHVSLLAVLRRRVAIIVLVTILSAGAAAGFAYLKGDTYESTAKLLFRESIGPEQVALGLNPGAPNATNIANSNVDLVGSRRVAVATSEQLRAGGWNLSPDDVQKKVVVTNKKDNDVVEMVASASTPGDAGLLASTYAKTAQRQAEDDQKALTDGALASIDQQLAQLTPAERLGGDGARLRSFQQKLRTLAEGGIGRATIIQPGYVPTSKAGKPIETIVLGALFGVILGAGLALLREQADRRLHHAEEVSAAFDAPVLTTVPRNRKLKRNVPFAELPPEVSEAFRMLQMNLRFGQERPVRRVLVTSSRSQEGKTTIAWNLACAAASAGLSVAFVEADLRRPTVAGRYGLHPGPGLSEAFQGKVSVANALQPFMPLPETVGLNGHQRPVHVLTAGQPPPDPWRLMQSPVMARVLEVVERDHDLVIIDTPPIAHVADAISLLRQVDGVIVVASVNSTEGPEAGRLRENLQTLGAKVLGVVANGGSAATGYAYAPAAPAAGTVPVADDGVPTVSAGHPLDQ